MLRAKQFTKNNTAAKFTRPVLAKSIQILIVFLAHSSMVICLIYCINLFELSWGENKTQSDWIPRLKINLPQIILQANFYIQTDFFPKTAVCFRFGCLQYKLHYQYKGKAKGRRNFVMKNEGDIHITKNK